MIAKASARLGIGVASALLLVSVAQAGNGLGIIQSVTLPCDARGGGSQVAIAPDGAHLYVGGFVSDPDPANLFENRIFIEARDTITGALSPAGSITVTTLSELFGDIQVSPDGGNVYVTGLTYTGHVYVYTRDSVTGALALLETHAEATTGETMLNWPDDIAISPDGAHVYVATDEGIVVYARNPLTGALSIVEEDAAAGSRGVAVSPDGAHVYVSRDGAVSDEVRAYTRDGGTGALTLAGMVSGLNRPGSLAVSGDGANVYLNQRDWPTGSMITFARNAGTGLLTTIDQDLGTDVGVVGFAAGGDVTLDAGGDQVYVASPTAPGAVVVFTRSGVDGSLTYLETQLDDTAGADGLGGASDVVVSPGGTQVYSVGEGTVTFDRDAGTGALTFVDDVENEAAPVSVMVSPDGAHVYRLCGRAIRTFARDAGTGFVTAASNVRIDAGAEMIIAPDGAHVYVDDGSGLLAFSRDGITGALTPLAEYDSGAGGMPALEGITGMAFSPDGTNLYLSRFDVGGTLNSDLVVLTRDTGTGLLALVEVVQESPGGADGIEHNTSIAVSPDGAHVYVGSFLPTFGPNSTNDGIAIFDRDAGTGSLTFVMLETVSGGGGSIIEGVTSLALSSDGVNLYAMSSAYTDEAMVRYIRDATTGLLARGDTLHNGVGPVVDFNNPNALDVAPDGAHVYVHTGLDLGGWGVTVLRRDPDVGVLGWSGMAAGGQLVDRYFADHPMASSPDSRQLYALGTGGRLLVLAEAPICTAAPLGGCDASTTAGLKVVEKLGPKDVLSWKWGAAGPIALGDPLTTTDFALCLYDASAGAQPLFSAAATAGGTCGTKSCWTVTSTGYKFADKLGTPDGVAKMKLVTGTAGKAKLVVKGKGATLPPLGLPYVTPVVVQLQASNGECWETSYTLPVLNDSTQFKASD